MKNITLTFAELTAGDKFRMYFNDSNESNPFMDLAVERIEPYAYESALTPKHTRIKVHVVRPYVIVDEDLQASSLGVEKFYFVGEPDEVFPYPFIDRAFSVRHPEAATAVDRMREFIKDTAKRNDDAGIAARELLKTV